jgi:hypothetical protein
MIGKSKPNFKNIPAMIEGVPIPPSMWEDSPRSIVAALKADVVLRALFDEMARKPGKNMLESHVDTIVKSHGVSRAFVFRALNKLDPERRKRMEQAAVTARALRSSLTK